MFYIHQSACISPRQTFKDIDLETVHEHTDNRLQALEPSYPGIPPGVLRRMGKAVRMGVGAAMAVLENKPKPDGIIIGSANGGKEDSVKFLNQVKEYDEGLLTPINFVQSTPNAIAAQIGLITNNHGYNITHLHLGLAFEFAIIDADMMLQENPSNTYLLGGVDDMSVYYYNSEYKAGWYKKEAVTANAFYDQPGPGSVAGEGAALFLVNNDSLGAAARLIAVDTLHHNEIPVMLERLSDFIKNNLPAGETIDLLLSGENGDDRLLPFFTAAESFVGDITVARFKHISGEYATASAIALWLSCNILTTQAIPGHMIKKQGVKKSYKNILIYNNYKGIQHGFMLVGNAQ